jgi:hypothetical protein
LQRSLGGQKNIAEGVCFGLLLADLWRKKNKEASYCGLLAQWK